MISTTTENRNKRKLYFSRSHFQNLHNIGQTKGNPNQNIIISKHGPHREVFVVPPDFTKEMDRDATFVSSSFYSCYFPRWLAGRFYGGEKWIKNFFRPLFLPSLPSFPHLYYMKKTSNKMLTKLFAHVSYLLSGNWKERRKNKSSLLLRSAQRAPSAVSWLTCLPCWWWWNEV